MLLYIDEVRRVWATLATSGSSGVFGISLESSMVRTSNWTRRSPRPPTPNHRYLSRDLFPGRVCDEIHDPCEKEIISRCGLRSVHCEGRKYE